MASVAEQLRQAREALHLSIHQVAEITKIKTEHIRALEAGEYDRFVAPVYIRGFVRTYAKMLKLDVDRIGADLDAELRRSEKFREPPPLTPGPQTFVDGLMLQVSRLNWRILAAALVLALAVVLAVLGLKRRDSRPEDALRQLGPGLYEPSSNAPTDLLPVPPSPR